MSAGLVLAENLPTANATGYKERMLVGQTIGPFFVDRELGSGAMGAVYRGRHKDTGQIVAIKMIAPGLSINPTALARFQRESAILKQLQHPNIVRILASGKFHGTPFYVMEYLEGESLDHVMARRGRITWEELVTLGQQLCTGLQMAHDTGIIHRDLKPSNLMISKDGTVKLTDFGIAKDTDVTALTGANSTVGTAAYMSPEQCRGSRDLTFKSDLYSMGVMFYELITGKKPFVAETAMEMFLLHAKAKPPRASHMSLEVPIWLDNLISQLLEKDPNKRPQSAAMVSDALGQVREKWEKQKSAGVEAAKKRKIDKTEQDLALDDQDREAARNLLGKKKKKPEKIPIHRQGWFAAVAAGGMLALLAGFLYFAFFKAASADALWDRAQAMMKSGDSSDLKRARDEPLTEFLKHHPQHAKAVQVQQAIDSIDLDLCERSMYLRREKMAPGDEAEPLARSALDDEDAGRLPQAAATWKSMLKFEKAGPDLRPWGLVARKYLGQIDEAERQYKELLAQVLGEISGQPRREVSDKLEAIGLDAVRLEQKMNTAGAGLLWDDARKLAEKQENRTWLLLSKKRLRDLVFEKK